MNQTTSFHEQQQLVRQRQKSRLVKRLPLLVSFVLGFCLNNFLRPRDSICACSDNKNNNNNKQTRVQTAQVPPPPPSPSEQSSSSSSSLAPLSSTKKVRSFTDILQESGSDKFGRHHYEQYYENWLKPFRSKPNITFLEIGAEQGRSLAVWNEYFDNHPQRILGLAYGDKTSELPQAVQGMDHVSIQFGDQSNNQTMSSLRQQGPWDIIIDDGSHVPKHMIYTLFSLWNSVKPGGLYIIEDLETNYWPSPSRLYGYRWKGSGIGAVPEFSAVSKIQQIQQVLIRHQIGAKELSVMQGDEDICSVEWGMNLVALKKCDAARGVIQQPSFALTPKYNIAQMKEWIIEAKRTNPCILC
jgi:hypothetical protein